MSHATNNAPSADQPSARVGSGGGFGGIEFTRDCWRCGSPTLRSPVCEHCDAALPWGEGIAIFKTVRAAQPSPNDKDQTRPAKLP